MAIERDKEKRLTREDVIKLIAEHEGEAFNVDLSGGIFEEDVDLSGLNLKGIILNGATLVGANLENANLEQAQLHNTCLNAANLQNANLVMANMQGTDISLAQLQGARLYGAYLSEVDLEQGIDWGNFILGDEKVGEFYDAIEVYRKLKRRYTTLGMYDIAGEFFFREMTAKRKYLDWWPNPFPRAWSNFISFICGYGERPLRVTIWAISVLLVFALAYFFFGKLVPNTFLDCLYYSTVSFVALGYGSWAPEPFGWVKWFGVVEAFVGIFTISLFLVTFTRKMTR